MPTGNVAVVGLGRIGLPLALSFASRGLDVVGVDKVPAVLESIASGRMPFQEPGTQELLERVLAGGRLRLTDRIEEAAECEHIVLTLGTPAFSHIEIDISDDPQRHRRPAAGPARGPLADPALHRRARHHRLAGRLHRAAARLHARARTCSSRTCRSGSPRAASWRRSTRCPASSAAWARARARRRPSCSRSSAPRSCRPPRCRPSWPRSGPTSSATPSSRCPTC